MNKRFLMFAAAASMFFGTSAKVKLPHLISDGMVIQQQSDVRLWGWDKPGKTIKVTTSWSSASYEAKTDKQGKWLVYVKSPEASFTPLSVTFDDGEPVTVNNILAGEVWVCAGQSNMEMPVKGFGQCPVVNYNLEVLNAADGVRSAKIPSRMSTKPLDDADTSWRISSPQTVSEFSATGYFFAKLVRKALNVPVGIIEANKGGSRVESWIDEDNLTKYTKENLDSTTMKDRFEWDFHYPLLWGNATFHPILNYTVKGILYYQGCSNVGDPAGQYTERLKMLVEQWRRDFKEGEIPFYFVQIAPYVYGDGVEGTSGAKLREQQFNATKVIPNSGMVCTNDLVFPYEKGQIHPAQKQQAGARQDLRSQDCHLRQYDLSRHDCSGRHCLSCLRQHGRGLQPLGGYPGIRGGRRRPCVPQGHCSEVLGTGQRPAQRAYCRFVSRGEEAGGSALLLQELRDWKLRKPGRSAPRSVQDGQLGVIDSIKK